MPHLSLHIHMAGMLLRSCGSFAWCVPCRSRIEQWRYSTCLIHLCIPYRSYAVRQPRSRSHVGIHPGNSWLYIRVSFSACMHAPMRFHRPAVSRPHRRSRGRSVWPRWQVEWSVLGITTSSETCVGVYLTIVYDIVRKVCRRMLYDCNVWCKWCVTVYAIFDAITSTPCEEWRHHSQMKQKQLYLCRNFACMHVCMYACVYAFTLLFMYSCLYLCACLCHIVCVKWMSMWVFSALHILMHVWNVAYLCACQYIPEAQKPEASSSYVHCSTLLVCICRHTDRVHTRSTCEKHRTVREPWENTYISTCTRISIQ